jgi:hypothetical protein
VLGTYLLVLFGTGSVAAAILTSAQMGLWQVADDAKTLLPVSLGKYGEIQKN